MEPYRRLSKTANPARREHGELQHIGGVIAAILSDLEQRTTERARNAPRGPRGHDRMPFVTNRKALWSTR